MNCYFEIDANLLDHTSDLKDFEYSNFVNDYLKEIRSALFEHSSGISLNSVLKSVEILIDYSWEKLNTNLWVFVDIKWRYLYAYSILYNIIAKFKSNELNEDLKTELVKLCDMGLLMSGPLLEKQFNQIIHYLSRDVESSENEVVAAKRAKIDSEESVVKLNENYMLKVEKSPSFETFRSDYYLTNTPVIIDGQMGHWPAMNKWSIDYLLSIAGKRTVPVEIGSKYTEADWSQKLMTLKDFIEKFIINGQSLGYLAQHPLFDQIPELRDDIYVPEYCYFLSEDENIDSNVDINAWFGPKGTISPLHQDPKQNFLCQVLGQKYVRLYDDKYRECLYIHNEKVLKNTSKIDFENLDFEKYPLLKNVPYWEGVLKEGQMLYIPPKCWHYIKSLSLSFSVSFWWN